MARSPNKSVWIKHIKNWTCDHSDSSDSSLYGSREESVAFFIKNRDYVEKLTNHLSYRLCYRGFSLTDKEFADFRRTKKLNKHYYDLVSFSKNIAGVSEFCGSFQNELSVSKIVSKNYYGLVLVKQIPISILAKKYGITNNMIDREKEILVSSSILDQKIEDHEWFLVPNRCQVC